MTPLRLKCLKHMRTVGSHQEKALQKAHQHCGDACACCSSHVHHGLGHIAVACVSVCLMKRVLHNVQKRGGSMQWS